MYNLNNLLV